MGNLMSQAIASDKSLLYKYQGDPIEVLPCFLYEVNLYKMAPRVVGILSSRYYTSNKLLKVKEAEVVKRFKNFNITRFVTLLGAPISFIEENNLPIYKLKKPTKKKKNHEKRTC